MQVGVTAEVGCVSTSAGTDIQIAYMPIERLFEVRCLASGVGADERWPLQATIFAIARCISSAEGRAFRSG